MGGTAVVCAYAVEKDTKLTLAVGTDRLEEADLMGNRSPLAAPGGRVTLDLTERPIYLVGAKLGSLAAVPASASVEMPQPDASSRVLWYRQPAERWLEALPVGNGRLGAMVFGGATEERLALNESTFWSGTQRSA